jgi:hypothetical protein
MINPADFKDIQIVDLNVDATQPSGRGGALREMHLQLSDTPPAPWSEIFRNEHRFPRHSMWREAWISGNHIVVDCVPEELEGDHLPYLKQDVENANHKYRHYLTKVAHREEQQRQSEQNEDQRLRSIRGRLGFN